MNLSIKEIKDIGNIEKERIVLKVEEDCDLGEYLLFNSKYLTDDTISSNIKNAYWIPDQLANKGDLVVVYSKSGTKGFKKNDDDTTSYFYYRAFENPILDESSAIVLLKSDNYRFRRVADLTLSR